MKAIIVLPVYNEAMSLGSLLKRIERAMAAAAVSYSVVLVDDGSSDGSLEIAQSLARSLPIEILRHRRNQGLGRTIRDGLLFAASRCEDQDVVVTLDADDSQPPDVIPDMLRKVASGCDVVIASRYAAGSRILGVPLHRRFLSRGGSLGYSLFVRAKGVRDYTSGFRAYRAGLLKKAVRVYGEGLIGFSGFECMGEILVKLARLGARFREIPFTLDYAAKRSRSKMRLIPSVIGNLRVLVMPRRRS